MPTEAGLTAAQGSSSKGIAKCTPKTLQRTVTEAIKAASLQADLQLLQQKQVPIVTGTFCKIGHGGTKLTA